jgi:hypothetical protein
VLAWLPDPELGAKAVAALWTLVRHAQFSAERQGKIRDAVRARYDAAPTPALARVLARIGTADDVAELTKFLDGTDDACCKAVAEGFVERGEILRLYDRSSDPRIEPFALDALARGGAELQNFQRLATLSVRPESLTRWSAAVRELARRLPASDIVAADDVLRADGRADLVQRSVVLSEVAARTENVSAEERIAVLSRLTPMLLQQGEAQVALELLESANGDHRELAPMRFEAALTVGRFDLAAQLESEPAPWIATLRIVASRDESAARRIRDEITARFGSVLTEADRRTLDGLDGVLGDDGG